MYPHESFHSCTRQFGECHHTHTRIVILQQVHFTIATQHECGIATCVSKSERAHCTDYVTLHRLRHTAQITSHCTDYVTLHGLHHTAQITSHCTDYVTLHRSHHTAQITSHCTDYVTLHRLRHTAQITSHCTDCVTLTVCARTALTYGAACLPQAGHRGADLKRSVIGRSPSWGQMKEGD